jgi:hypothetical protein
MSNPPEIENFCRVCGTKTRHEKAEFADNAYTCVICRVVKTNPWMDMVECLPIFNQESK